LLSHFGDIKNIKRSFFNFEKNQVNIYKKVYFIDFSVHSFVEIKKILTTLSPQDSIMLRRYSEKYDKEVRQIIAFCKKNNIAIFSHHLNTCKACITHFASSFYTSNNKKSISFHSMKDLHRLKKINPTALFLSPIFKTKTHPEMHQLGVIQAFKMAQIIKDITPKTKIYLLGGMTQERFHSIKIKDENNYFEGYAGMRSFV
jgi:hypothetical protein